MTFKRTDKQMDTFLMSFHMLRDTAESRMVIGSGFPDEFASALWMRNGASAKNEKSPAPASVRSAPALPEVSSHMRRLFGPRGSAARHGVLAAADVDAVSEEEDFEAWAAYRKARKEKRKEPGGDDRGEPGGGKFKDGKRTSNASNRETANRNRCFTRNCGEHYAPQRQKKKDRSKGASPYQKIAEQRNPADRLRPSLWNVSCMCNPPG